MRKETRLMLVFGIMCSLSKFTLCEVNTTQEEEAIPECLQKLMDCFEEHVDNDLKDPKFDRDSPEFDQKEYLCCSLMQQTVVPEKECLCSSIGTPFFFLLLDDTLGRPAKDEADNGTRVLKLCGVVDDSVPSIGAFCKDTQSFQELTTTTPSTPAKTDMPSNIASGRKYSTFMVVISILICVSIHLYNT
ncbi:uncharacterized protein LOC141613359 [Silene latifolia]|uniref:uncharacterized protein LOC141613359 n=1 Tax=Silene latifolia TaxID=37657 RepID=UPI003D76BDF9